MCYFSCCAMETTNWTCTEEIPCVQTGKLPLIEGVEPPLKGGGLRGAFCHQTSTNSGTKSGFGLSRFWAIEGHLWPSATPCLSLQDDIGWESKTYPGWTIPHIGKSTPWDDVFWAKTALKRAFSCPFPWVVMAAYGIGRLYTRIHAQPIG